MWSRSQSSLFLASESSAAFLAFAALSTRPVTLARSAFSDERAPASCERKLKMACSRPSSSLRTPESRDKTSATRFLRLSRSIEVFSRSSVRSAETASRLFASAARLAICFFRDAESVAALLACFSSSASCPSRAAHFARAASRSVSAALLVLVSSASSERKRARAAEISVAESRANFAASSALPSCSSTSDTLVLRAAIVLASIARASAARFATALACLASELASRVRVCAKLTSCSAFSRRDFSAVSSASVHWMLRLTSSRARSALSLASWLILPSSTALAIFAVDASNFF